MLFCHSLLLCDVCINFSMIWDSESFYCDFWLGCCLPFQHSIYLSLFPHPLSSEIIIILHTQFALEVETIAAMLSFIFIFIGQSSWIFHLRTEEKLFIFLMRFFYHFREFLIFFSHHECLTLSLTLLLSCSTSSDNSRILEIHALLHFARDLIHAVQWH